MMYLANGQFDRCDNYVGQSPTRHDTRNGLTVTHQPYPSSHINPNSSVTYTTNDQAMLIEDQLTASGNHGRSGRGNGRRGGGGGGGSRLGSRRGIHRNKQPEIRPWNSSLLACCDDPEICITGLACSPCLASRLSERLGENPLACCLPFGCVALRVKLRTQHHIRGDICSDYGVSCCCGCPLSLCQMWRELDYIEKKSNPGGSASNGSHGNQPSTSSRSFLDMLTF